MLNPSHMSPTITICCCVFFFFNDTATTEIYTLSLHDALPILHSLITGPTYSCGTKILVAIIGSRISSICEDRKSTRLNSSHSQISYAVFCLKKKKINNKIKYTHCILTTHAVPARDLFASSGAV